MKIGLCCIGKMENRYIKEFVEHYKKIGVDTIFIYDNNDKDGEHFEDVLQEYIDENFVNIIDFRGQKICQLKAYQDCYDKYNKEYDWIAFFDCDEFLYLVKHNNIKDYLSDDVFKEYDMIHINWMIYGDNDLVHTDGNNYSVLERFTKPVLPYDFKRSLSFPENNHIKSIIRGNRTALWKATPHTPINQLKCCDNNGKEIQSTSPYLSFNYKTAYIKHFTTKTVEEYYNKIVRGFPDHKVPYNEQNDMANRFFAYNKRTIEKENILGINEDNASIYICAHKDFKDFPNNKAYKIIHGEETINVPLEQISEKDEGDNLLYMQHSYGEGSRIYWIYKHEDLKEYIGICHYSKYFEFYDNIPNLKLLFNNYDVILPTPMNVGQIYGQYGACHNIEDLVLVGEVIKKLKPTFHPYYIFTMQQKILFPCNMFIMKKDDFKEYCDFVFTILKGFNEERGFNTMQDITKYVIKNKGKYLKSFSPNNKIDYQDRMNGFLLERLTNVFIYYKFKKVYTVDIVETDEKYGRNVFKAKKE